MAHDVFVSHSVKDKAVAEKIVARLEAESIRCWVAPRDVVPGADWGESIIDAIGSSRIMILIFSRSANLSPQIKREVERAVDKEVYMIPFRVEDIEPTKALEYFISTSQWMDAFAPPLEQHLDKLAYAVKAILVRPPDVAAGANKPVEPVRRDETPDQARDSARHSPVWLKPVTVVLGLLILGAAAWYSFGQKRVRLDERKGEQTPPLLAFSPSAISTPRLADSGPNQEKDNINRPEVANPLPNARVQPPSAAPAISPTRQDLREESTPQNEYRPEEPSGVVRRYYDSINRRDLTQAYDCLSKGFKARSTIEKFAQIFASTQSIEIRTLQEDSRDDATAVVTVSFMEVDAENHSHEWKRRVSLSKEGDAWRIDRTQSTTR
jgi:hypothetical protein